MVRQAKTHAIALAAITFIVVVLYLIINPQPAADANSNPYATGDRYVRIISADWGMNCNAEINRYNAQPSNGPARKPLPLVTTNNATPTLSDLCNGRLQCSTTINTATLQFDPAPSCFKKMEISYRCFSIDRLRHSKVDQGDSLTLDCNESADQGTP